MKNITFAILTCLCVQLLRAQQNKDTVLIYPQNPKAGQAITVTFKTGNPAFTNKKNIDGGLYIFNAKLKINTIDLLFKKNENGFVASATLPSTAVAFAVNVMDSALNPYKADVSLVYDEWQNPVPLAYKAIIRIYDGYSKSFGINAQKAKENEYEEIMFNAIKDTMKSFSDKLEYYQYKKDTAQLLQLFASLLDTSKQASEDDYFFAADGAKRMKQKALADTLAKIKVTKFPNNVGKGDAYKKIYAEKDIKKQLSMLHQFIINFPDDAKLGVPIASLIQQTIAIKYAAEGNFDEAAKNIPANFRGSELASIYNSIAWQSCLKNKNLKQAAALSKASLDTIKALEISGYGKPAAYTKPKYIKTLERTYAMYEDTYAYLLYKNGDYNSALAEEKAVLKIVPNDKESIERYHMILEKVAPSKQVIASLANYIAKDLYDSAMEVQFKRLYQGSQPLDVYWAKLTSKAQAAKTANFVKTILNEPAAKFALFDLESNKVSLESLKGKTVVLDFWATWCGPCKASFPAMKQVVDKYKNNKDVVVLFVDSWQTEDDKTKNAADYIKQTSYPFHVLLDNDNKVVSSYLVSGIPTKFVIDKNGNIRFKTIGYNGNEKETVNEMSDMIEIASK